jgi:LVIVD repeat-containing protein
MRSASRLIGLIAILAAPALVSAQSYPSAADPRTNLKPGRLDAGTAASNMRLVSFSPKPAQFDSARGLTFINSDLAFGGHYVYQGNFAGFTVWDVSDPAKPVVASVVECITSQGDPSIVGNLLFVSAEGAGNRNDCAKGGVHDPKDHMTGVRIYDVSNPSAPKLIKNVQTCKGSHTHTVIPSPTDKNIIYIYVSGQQAARPDSELVGCKNGTDPADPTNSLYQLDIIKVPLDHPEQAKVIPGARIFTGLEGSPDCITFCAPADTRRPPRRAADAAAPNATPAGAPNGAPAPDPLHTGPRNCHDVTAYPAYHLLAAACSSYAIMVDISNPEKPVRLAAITDTNNFQGRHTAGFSNDGKKTLWTDEWGGGTGPMCQAGSIMELGGNTIVTLSADNKKMTQRSYFKLPSAQTAQENCVSHNGGLIPVPGRDLYVQGWYQGGVDVMDFTDADHPTEIAYFDRGPIDEPNDTANASARSRYTIGGSWGAYYWNGYIYSSELDRGFDVYELTPSPQLSANEIAAAKLVTLKEFNPQSQPKYVWPAAFPVVRSYLDQLVRNGGLTTDKTTAIGNALDAAEKQSGAARAASLNKLARQVDADVKGAKDSERVKTMASEIRRLAAASK